MTNSYAGISYEQADLVPLSLLFQVVTVQNTPVDYGTGVFLFDIAAHEAYIPVVE